jgi:hypothetical protein
MTRPDIHIIAEVILFCYGFEASTLLSKKIVKAFQFAQL